MFSENFKIKRLMSGFTQQYVAEYLNISPQSISKWENGTAMPSIEFLPKLAECFNCQIDDFFRTVTTQNNIEQIKTFWAILRNYISSGENSEKDKLVAFVKENHNILDEMKKQYENIIQKTIINERSASELLMCSCSDAKLILDDMVACEILHSEDEQGNYKVIRNSFESVPTIIDLLRESSKYH